ncbi:hypothetical protein ACFTSF_35370 [Kribbella sp. NPDC056951]|uniref:hypothetical protein n=1 Tax=Kribbella sp. NPDC056951 TaxID=3345978 RepID=UPI003639F5C9
MTDYLRWLAVNREVLFHGSPREDLRELRTDRETGDSTAYGRQQAVFATDDPVWAMWFALMPRGGDLRSTRNGVWSVRGDSRSRYFFSVDSDLPDGELLTDGWMYVLPRHGFTREPALARVLQSGQWVSPDSVRPLAHLAVTPADFPLAAVVGRHSEGDSMLKTLRAARTAFRRSTRGSAQADG